MSIMGIVQSLPRKKMMMREHEGKYICGYCKKETPLEDDVLIPIIDGQVSLPNEKPICSCGHFSYASSIRLKAFFNPKDWIMTVGHST